MESLFEEIGIPPKYLQKSVQDQRYVALVHKHWLKSLIKHFKLIEFIEKSKFDVWHINDDFHSPWTKIFLSVFKKKNAHVFPLPRIRPNATRNDDPLLLAQLMQYVSQTNYKYSWKQAYKKYNKNGNIEKESQVTLTDYNYVLKETILRIYGCPIINTLDSSVNKNTTSHFDVHLNVLPVFCGVETLNAIFLLHNQFIEHNVLDCVTFSPAILDKCYTKSLFIVYQLIELLKSLHDRSLTLGDITLNDIYLTEDLWIYVFPQICSNISSQDVAKSNLKGSSTRSCREMTRSYTSNDSVLSYDLYRSICYDKVQTTENDGLENLCKLWIQGKISNFTYISALNKFSGRKLGDPNCHYVFPWVTDFASYTGKNWRDLRKSKYRLNKGDRQLDLTYDHSQTQAPHHVSDVLSSITYYVYMARRTPKSVLCKNVRTVWVPAEYPSSIQRMQEWTPDECIPEFFNDPSVFRSIHNDLDDLEIPSWASSPEDFIEKHRQALESDHVSERLHSWIDLTFGYKLSGNAAVKAKNVCLHLADDHRFLTKSGIVQLFSHPHPSKNTAKSSYWCKTPPICNIKELHAKSRERNSSNNHGASGDEEENLDGGPSTSGWTPLALTKILSRSRSSLHEEASSKPIRSLSGTRSTSTGSKNSTFTSHVAQKSKSNQSTIYLPKDYQPDFALENLEKQYSFTSKMFYYEHGKRNNTLDDDKNENEQNVKTTEDCLVQNAFTNFMYSDNFDKLKPKTKKSFTFPMDEFNKMQRYKITPSSDEKLENQVICSYSNIISSKKIKELQILGCLIVEIFMARQLRSLGLTNTNLSLTQRLKRCITVVKYCQKTELPSCISRIVNLLLQPNTVDFKQFSYPVITEQGLPSPSAHLLLEPLLNCVVPFPKGFRQLYSILTALNDFKTVALELNVLYHFDCDGTMCAEYENLERTKILFAQNIAECKVKNCAKQLDQFLVSINVQNDTEVINILLPHIRELIEDPPTSILAVWYLFDPISKVLGPKRSADSLLESILKLYESEPSETYLPYNGKIAKIYHHSFLLRLIVRLGLKCFLDNFVTPLVEAVGGYKELDWKSDSLFHTHHEKIVRKTSHLKNMDAENTTESSISDETCSTSDTSIKGAKFNKFDLPKDEEIFELDEEKETENQMKSLIEHLELNISTDLPLNASAAEEALDATLLENIDPLKNVEEDEEITETVSPTIPIPSTSHHNVANISCDIGSKKSETDSMNENKPSVSQSDLYLDSPSSTSTQPKTMFTFSKIHSLKSKKSDMKISQMSSDSIIWLSHRLGPVLMAKYLSRNLLKMLTLCYVGKTNLQFNKNDDELEAKESVASFSITSSRVIGDEYALKVLECLANIAGLYGEKLIIVQYLPHMTELLALCKKRLTQTLEGGLISCLVLLKYIIPYLSDTTLMDQLQEILMGIIYPALRLLGTTKRIFPNGSLARNILARKYVDTLYVLSIRIGSDMSRTYLSVPYLQRFFLNFDKVYEYNDENMADYKGSSEKDSYRSERLDYVIGTKPVQVSHVRLKDSESFDSLSPTLGSGFGEENVKSLAYDELREVFTSELAYKTYVPFLKHIGIYKHIGNSKNSLEISLKNHELIRKLCKAYEQELKTQNLTDGSSTTHFELATSKSLPTSSSIGSNISVIGNRIDIQREKLDTTDPADLLSLVSNRMENGSRHLKGNWFSYWAHEIGRSEKNNSFNFNQIKLQTFVGHTSSVKSLYILNNENSFMSGSRDKTVKLWSLRSQGDGSSMSNCQWTYTAHKKSILSLTFIDSMRLAVSSDSTVHLWDPFMGVIVGQLESPKISPVNVVKSMLTPSSIVFSATTEGTIKIIDARLLNYVYDLKVTVNPSGLIRCLAIAPSGNWIAVGQSSGNITVLDTRTGLVLSSWRAHEGEVLQLVTPNDNSLISSSLDQTISVWDINDGKFRHHMRMVSIPRGPTEPAHCLCLYDYDHLPELISATTANRIGVHTDISSEASYSSTKLRNDSFKGLLTSMGILPLNKLLLLGADNGQISLLC